MARMSGPERPGWIARAVFVLFRRELGRVPEPSRIAAHTPGLLLARVANEVALERATRVDRRVRKLAELKVAMLVGCHF